MKKYFYNLLLILSILLVNTFPVNASTLEFDKQQQFENEFYKALEKSDNIKIRFLNTSTQNTNNYSSQIENANDLVALLEKQELNMNSISLGEAESSPSETVFSSMKAAGKSKTISASGTRGATLKIRLRADITYNTSTNKISKVFNRKLTFSGLTVGFKATDRTYKTTYSSTKKTCTIRCDYSEVSELTTPLGDIEITRRDAYQQFKWSKSKGTYGIKGGYV